MVAKTIADWLQVPIFCIRQAQEPVYTADAAGIVSDQRRNYLSGILGLLLCIRFWKQLLAARIVICNTCLTFPFAVLARLLGKRVVCVIHESAYKNVLYRVALFWSKKAAHRIITPSRLAFEEIGIPAQKWQVIPNALARTYSEECPSVDSHAAEARILFVGGGRPYKGDHLFQAIQEHCRIHHPRLQLHAVGDDAYVRAHGFGRKLTPQIYGTYHLILVLTDNRVWKETFGLVGCEAAACRCLPMFTDRFAYAELWSEYADQLFLPTYAAGPIVEQLVRLLRDRLQLDRLRDAARQHALQLTDARSVAAQWRNVLQRIDTQPA